MQKEPINFMENMFNCLSPFSAHRIEIWGEVFPTVEHAYQAARIKSSPERDEIKNSPSPEEAWRLGQKYKKIGELLVKNFNKDIVMEELFRAKMKQHIGVVEALEKTKGYELQKVIATDYYWGTGADGLGENKMGKLWMRLRNELCK